MVPRFFCRPRLVRVSLPLLAAGLMGLSACAPVLRQVVQIPTFKVHSARLTGLTLTYPAVAHVSLKLLVDNPNPVGAHLANIAGNFYLNGSAVGHFNLPDVALSARGSSLQTAELDLPVSLNTAATWLKVARGQEMPYRLDGTFTANLGALGSPSFGPYTLTQGLFKQAAILP